MSQVERCYLRIHPARPPVTERDDIAGLAHLALLLEAAVSARVWRLR